MVAAQTVIEFERIARADLLLIGRGKNQRGAIRRQDTTKLLVTIIGLVRVQHRCAGTVTLTKPEIGGIINRETRRDLDMRGR